MSFVKDPKIIIINGTCGESGILTICFIIMSFDWEESRMVFLSKYYYTSWLLFVISAEFFYKSPILNSLFLDHQACSQLQNHESFPSQRSIRKSFQNIKLVSFISPPKRFHAENHLCDTLNACGLESAYTT